MEVIPVKRYGKSIALLVLLALITGALWLLFSYWRRTAVDPYWRQAVIEAYKRPADLLAQDAQERRQGRCYRKLFRGNPAIRTVALTFDDGPHPRFTPQLLALLARYHIKATFFVVGTQAERYPALVRAEAAAGHVIGNHTYHHKNLTRLSATQVMTEWLACNNVVHAATGTQPTLCRPPGGDYTDTVIGAAMACNLTTVLWTDDPSDYARPGTITIARRTLDTVDNGAIILLHDGVQQTLDALPHIIDNLQRRGFGFETVDEMLAASAKQPAPHPGNAPPVTGHRQRSHRPGFSARRRAQRRGRL